MFGHNHHIHVFHFHFKKELSEVYLSYAIRSFACALVSIFIPAFLFSLGYSLKAIAFFYLFYALFMGFGCILTASLTAKIGIKHVILISGPLTVLQFLMLYSLDIYYWPLTVLALVSAAASAFFWPAFHLEFVRVSDHKHRAEEIGALNVFSYLTVIAAPLLGSLVITFFGFHVLFITVSVILCVSPIPLFFTRERYEPCNFSIKDVFCKKNFREASVFFGNGIMSHVHSVIWPLFVFLALGTFLSLGILSTLFIGIVTVTTYILGRVSDKAGKHKMLKVGAIPGALIWFTKPFASLFWHFSLINFLEGITSSFVNIPFFGIFYNRAQKRENTAEYIILREFVLNALGGGLVFFLFLITESFNLSFILAGISTYCFIFF